MSFVHISDIPTRRGTRVYPEAFREPFENREKKGLSDAVGLTQFGVNHVKLEPGAYSSLRHWHHNEDEFVYILKGEVTVIDDSGERIALPGTCIGFKAGSPNAHHLANRSAEDVEFLEVGNRYREEEAEYADVDLHAKKIDSQFHFTHKDGTPY